jgi:hypothetical protein
MRVHPHSKQSKGDVLKKPLVIEFVDRIKCLDRKEQNKEETETGCDESENRSKTGTQLRNRGGEN